MITKEQLHPDDWDNWQGFVSYICGKWEIVRRYRPETIIEIGVRAGYAGWAFLQAHPGAEYIGFDNFSYGAYPQWASEHLLAGDGVEIRRVDSQQLETLGVMADFIHVDGDHSTAGVIHDLDLSLAALNPGGVILVDDYDRIPEVRTGVDEWIGAHPELDWKYCESFTGDVLIGNVYRTGFKHGEKESAGMTGSNSGGTNCKSEAKLLVFHHGLGDLLLFKPLYEYLQQQGEYCLAVQEGCGFASLMDGAVETPAGEFDYGAFCSKNGFGSFQVVRFDMSEGSGLSKTECCAVHEFGLSEYRDDYTLPSVSGSRVIGVNFHGTCLPGLTNPDELTARLIWNEIKAAGYTPLEVHFEHRFHNPVNRRYEWVDSSTRGIPPNLDILFGLLAGCAGFVGVMSGVWVAAVNCMGQGKILTLEKAFSRKDYFPGIDGLSAVDIEDYQAGLVRQWLENQ